MLIKGKGYIAGRSERYLADGVGRVILLTGAMGYIADRSVGS